LKTLLSYAIDAFALAGCAAILFGVAKIHPPSAWILGGLMMFAAAVFMASSLGRK
jgi:hypothetical protein